MRHSTHSVLILALVTACKQAPDDTQDTTVIETDVPPECEVDDDCRAGSICDEGDCAAGDRDNGFPEATSIFQDTPVAGLINPDGDVDYFAYTSVGEEWLRIETTPDEVADGLDTVVSVFNAGGGLHAIEDDYPMGNVSNYDTVMYVYLPTAGVWYITVEDRSSSAYYAETDAPLRGDPSFAYQLALKKFSNVTDETDAIDDPSAKVELANGATSYAVGVVLEEAGDTDWISVSLPYDRGPLEVRGNAYTPGTTAEARVEAWSPTGELVCQKDGVGPDGVALYFDTTKDTWMVGASEVNGEDGWYTLFVRTREPDYYRNQFDTEPDDSATDPLPTYAATTSSGEDYLVATITGALTPEGDVDRYRIAVEADEYLTLYCSADAIGSLGDPAVELFTPDGASLAAASDGDDRAPDLINVDAGAAGEVTVQVTGEDSVWGPSAYYLCTLYVTPFKVAE